MEIQPHTPLKKPIKIAIVGEAPGSSDMTAGEPFKGHTGAELTRMLLDAGIVRDDCYITTVFKTQPPGNSVFNWCTKKKEATEIYRHWLLQQALSGGVKPPTKSVYPFPPLAAAKYLDASMMKYKWRLHDELNDLKPNIVIALGNVAAWALMDTTGMKNIRGVVTKSPYLNNIKVIPTYHPSSIIKNWSYRAVAICDLMKAEKESKVSQLTIPEGIVWISPTLDDVKNFKAAFLDSATEIGYDVETGHRGVGNIPQITCLGFSTKRRAIVIPLVDKRKPNYSYWTPEEEKEIWYIVRDVLASSSIKVMQNGMYDVQYSLTYGWTPRNFTADTMLMHHSLQPELPKDLGFLGSVYTNFPSWKDMRPRGNQATKAGE